MKGLFCLLCLLGWSAVTAWSGGFESGGLGARATGMGGAFIGVADDWTAVYWNPGGLARLKGTEISGGVEYVRILAHDSQGLVNAQIPFTQANLERGDVFSQFGGEPSQFNGQDSDFHSPLPSAGFYTQFRGMTIAAGSYTPLGFAFDVTDPSQPGYNAAYKSDGLLINHNLSIAKTIYPGVSIGAGVNLVQAKLDRTAYKVTPLYESSIGADSKALGVQGVFGMMIDLGTQAHVGAVYRTGEDLSLHGHAYVNDGRFPPESTDFTQTVRDPTTYGVGLSVLPWTTLTLSADWQRTEWSAWRQKVQFDQQGLILQNQDINPGWASTNRYRFGAEWRAWKGLSVRAGYFRDPRAVSFESQALTGLIDPDAHYVTSGISYRWTRWQIDLSNQYGASTENVDGIVIRKEVNSFTTQLDYFL